MVGKHNNQNSSENNFSREKISSAKVIFIETKSNNQTSRKILVEVNYFSSLFEKEIRTPKKIFPFPEEITPINLAWKQDKNRRLAIYERLNNALEYIDSDNIYAPLNLSNELEKMVNNVYHESVIRDIFS